MPLNLSAYRIDLEASRDGAWFASEPYFTKGVVRLAKTDEPAWRICYWDSKPFQAVLAEKLAEAGEDAEKRVEAVPQAMAKRLVTDWRGQVNDAGDAEPFSAAALLAKLTDETLPQAYQFAWACSHALDRFRKQQERSLGN